MKDETRRLSKFLSYVLRHNPGEFGLELGPGGWVSVDKFLAAASVRDERWTLARLQEIVATDDKTRYTFSDDGLSVRANQGHSVEVDLGLEPVEPPDVLYHGTATRFEASIREGGLVAMNRHHVHLSIDHETAVTVGKRHGKVLVLEIDARRMHEDGCEFYVSANGVWLTEAVPPEYFLDPIG